MSTFNVVILGSGNLATQLSLALLHSGINILQVYSPNLSHAEALASRLGCAAVCTLDSVVSEADAFIVAIKDDVVSDFIHTLREGREHQLIIHTAGSIPLVMQPVADGVQSENSVNSPAGCHSCNSEASHSSRLSEKTYYPSAVLYPMQTFSKLRDVNFKEIPCFIEATDSVSLEVVRSLATQISERVIELSSPKRRQLHLAAVFANNLTNHCYRLAEKSLEGTGLDFDVLLPLISETASKVASMPPKSAQTGPMKRNDVSVMSKQLELIPDSLTRQIYSDMATSIYQDNI